MCDGFGVIVTKDLKIWFVEPDINGDVSHERIIDLLILSKILGKHADDGIKPRTFVRVEFPEWTEESFRFDQPHGLPTWCEASADEIQERCVKLMLRVKEPWYICRANQDKVYKDWQKRYLSCKEDMTLSGKLCSTDWNEMHNKKVDYYNKFVKEISVFDGYIEANDGIDH